MLKFDFLQKLEFFKEKKLKELLAIINENGIEALNGLVETIIKQNKGKVTQKWDLLLNNIFANFANNKSVKNMSLVEDFSIQIYNKIIENTNSDKIEVNSCLADLKEIIFAIIPLIEIDQDKTQKIYEIIVDLVEKYIKLNQSIKINQVRYNNII